jgi:hypothetical protein
VPAAMLSENRVCHDDGGAAMTKTIWFCIIAVVFVFGIVS